MVSYSIRVVWKPEYYENLGYKCITQEKLFEVLYELLENGMTQDYKYIEYADKFFEMRDEKNCQRVYEAIVDS